jgi:hypothetical protein
MGRVIRFGLVLAVIMVSVTLGQHLFGQSYVDDDGAVQFHWDPVTDWGADAVGSHYQLWMADSPSSKFFPVGPQVVAGIEVVDILVGACNTAPTPVCASNNTVRYYAVTAENSLGIVSGFSNVVDLQFVIGPSKPANLLIAGASGPM